MLDCLPSNLPIDRQGSGGGEIMPGPERRRRWSGEEKARIVAESFAPGVAASSVAVRHGLHRNQLYSWRRELREGACGVSTPGVSFAPIMLTSPAAPARASAIEIALGGAVVRVVAGADVALLSDILRLLKRPS